MLEYIKMLHVDATPEQKKWFLASILKQSPEKKVKMDGSFVGVGLDQNTFMFEGFVPINAEKENIVDIDCKTKVHGFFFGVRFHVGYGKTNRILGLWWCEGAAVGAYDYLLK